jgi:AraC-like DNA-binding protein
MKITVLSLIYLLGAIQAVLLLFGINLNNPLISNLKKTTSLLLTAIMITMVYYVVILNHFQGIYPFIDSLGSAAWMAITPFYYLLNLSIQQPKWEFQKSQILYFIFPIAFLIEGALNTLGYPFKWYQLASSVQSFLDLWMLAFFGTGFYFIIRCVLLHRKTKQAEEMKNKELIWFTYTFLVILIVFALIFLLIRGNYVPMFEFILIGLFEVFVFLLVYKVFQLIPLKNIFESRKYSNKTLSKNEFETLAGQLEEVREKQKPFLDQNLSLNDLSKASGIHTNDLSQLFNLYYRSNFYNFINKYRLKHLEGLILDPAFSQYKIMALAQESGFNSKATFYKVFKEKHQLTPTQFIKKELGK